MQVLCGCFAFLQRTYVEECGLIKRRGDADAVFLSDPERTRGDGRGTISLIKLVTREELTITRARGFRIRRETLDLDHGAILTEDCLLVIDQYLLDRCSVGADIISLEGNDRDRGPTPVVGLDIKRREFLSVRFSSIAVDLDRFASTVDVA